MSRARSAAALAGRQPSILLVERDADMGERIVEQLIADGHPTALALTAAHARALAAISSPALAILGPVDGPDGEMPAAAGALGLLREIRNHEAPWPDCLPVIVLGSRPRSTDMLRAFAAGADDFLAHPGDGGGGDLDLDYLELRARLRSLLRRASRSTEPALAQVRVGPLLIDPSSRSVCLHDRPVQLRPREYELLLHLARAPTRVFPKPELLRAVWGFQAPSGSRTLDSHACRLRRQLVAHSSRRWVLNVRGVGYRLTA